MGGRTVLLGPMTEQRILVTGTSGYLGRELVKSLRERAIETCQVDRRPSGDAAAHCFDLCDGRLVRDHVAAFSPTHVVHCGTHSASAYQTRFLSSYKEDSVAVTNLLETIGPAVRLVFLSSSYVFSGLPTDWLVTEETPLAPIHNFGVAKAFFEQLIMRTHPNSVVFRLSSVFGPGQPDNPNAIADMTDQCLTTGRVVVWGAGARKMQYVWIGDVIESLERALQLSPGLYHLGGDEYLSTAMAAEAIANRLGAEVVFDTSRREGMTLPRMDTTKLNAATGLRWRPILDGIREYVAERKSVHG